MRIRRYPDPVLRKRAEPLLEVDDSVRERAREMGVLMLEEDGIGLAAPQVGWSVRLMVVNPTFEEGAHQVLINPEIVEARGEQTEEEGCLSFPGIKSRVKRALRVKVTATDLDGEPLEIDAEELHARLLQHELDHLDGQLFIDRISPAAKMAIGKELERLRAEMG